MIGIIAMILLVSCLLASMYETHDMINRNYSRIGKGAAMTPGGSTIVAEKTIRPSDLEKMAMSELPEMLDHKPAGLLGELYVKKEVYVRKDLAEK